MKKKKSKMGRPPLKAKDRKVACVTLRLNRNDRKRLEQDAEAQDMSLSSYLLDCWQKVRK
jgi:uncharacterized protein (DUF1778 family)